MIVDTATGKQRRELTKGRLTSYSPGGLAFGKDGAKLYYRFLDKIVEYEVATGKALRIYEIRAGDISSSPDGNTLLTAGGRLRFFDVSGKEIASLLDDSEIVSAEAHAFAVKLVERYGGKVLRDEKQPGQPVIAVSLSRVPFPDGKKGGLSPASWPSDVLKELKQFKQLASLDLSGYWGVTGKGFIEWKELKHLTTLQLGGTDVTDAGLKELKELKGLNELSLQRTAVTDAGLSELKELKQLTKLDLTGTKVTDAGLKELKDLKELKELFLLRTQVTDPGVKELQKALPTCKIHWGAAKGDDLAKLVEELGGKITRDDTQPGNPVIGVNLARNKRVTDVDLKALKEFKQITTLDLKFSPVTDAGLKDLKELKQLTKLYVGGTEVTDEGLKELKELKQLTTLDLGATKVTDAGLKELKELRQLQELILTSCSNVTDAGVKELQEALPKCKIKALTPPIERRRPIRRGT